jgi:hypothetical protein
MVPTVADALKACGFRDASSAKPMAVFPPVGTSTIHGLSSFGVRVADFSRTLIRLLTTSQSQTF